MHEHKLDIACLECIRDIMRERDKLKEMLKRILSEGIEPLGGGLWLDSNCDQDIVEWYKEKK